MEEKKQYKNTVFLDNIETTVEMSFDQPKFGTSAKDGKPWIRYACKEGGEFSSFFADEMLHKILVHFGVKKGTSVTIGRMQYKDNKKRHFWQVSCNGQTVTSDSMASLRTATAINKFIETHKVKTSAYSSVEGIWNLLEYFYGKAVASPVIKPEDQRECAISAFIQACRDKARVPENPSIMAEPSEAVEEIPVPTDSDLLPF
jgi:hypothetical protein